MAAQVAVETFLGVLPKEAASPTDGAIATLVTDRIDGWCDRVTAADARIE